ncbi:MAG TPA: hypothetical protein VE078_06535 [Thermoanaerobaculia bacterium]|nr:hypothetical protein [Thermoanaerobaculia bacterium]
MALRLKKLRNGHGLMTKAKFAMMPRAVGFPPSDVIRTLAYRPQSFGKAFSSLVQSALRGPSFWTVAERELFAGYVSARNQCLF